jgi:uncharacterized membrane protein YfhO
MDLLKANTNLKSEAGFVASFPSNKDLKEQTFVLDSNASAKLLTYHPDTMNYSVTNSNDGYLVFSEIYYEDWKAQIDGKPVTINKVDYAFRGILVPAGKHTVKLYFEKSEVTTDHIEQYISIAILLGMLILIIVWLLPYFKNKTA